VRGRRDDALGRLLLRLAVVLHRSVTSKEATRRLLRQRNAALRRAHGRGVPVEELAKQLGLTPSWVRSVVGLRGAPPSRRASVRGGGPGVGHGPPDPGRPWCPGLLSRSGAGSR